MVVVVHCSHVLFQTIKRQGMIDFLWHRLLHNLVPGTGMAARINCHQVHVMNTLTLSDMWSVEHCTAIPRIDWYQCCRLKSLK